jgi:hypothetical protein
MTHSRGTDQWNSAAMAAKRTRSSSDAHEVPAPAAPAAAVVKAEAVDDEETPAPTLTPEQQARCAVGWLGGDQA